jgi:hypothetical protein
MSLDTYSNLKDEIASYLDRDDLTDNIDTFIDLAEADHKRVVRIREMIKRDSLTVNARYVDLPSDFLEPLSFRLLTSPLTILNELNFHEMNRVRSESNGKPEYFVTHGSEIEFNKSPDQSYSGEITYYYSLTPLSSGNTTNAILERAPDLYLYGALTAAEPFMMNDPRIQTWAALYQNALNGVNGMDRKRSGPLVSRVAGATP